MSIPKRISVVELMNGIQSSLSLYGDPHRVPHNPFEEKLAWHVQEAEKYREFHLPEGTRLRFAKRVILRLMRVYTRVQLLFHLNVVQYLLNLNAKSNFLSNRLEREISTNQGRLEELSISHRSTLETLHQVKNEAATTGVALRQTQETLHQVINQVTALAGRPTEIEELRTRIAQIEQALSTMAHNVVEPRLAERVAMLERRSTYTPQSLKAEPSTNAAHFNYLLFEESFRGNQTAVKERQSSYLEHLSNARNVLDLGCGRGEFLDVVRSHGISAMGIDVDAGMVACCLEKGLDVKQADALAFLQSSDQSWDAIFASHLLEHLQLSGVIQLVQLCYDHLERGGVFIAETPNPQCLMVYAGSFVVDPTHVRPLHPATLSFLLLQNGFVNPIVEYKTPFTDHLPSVSRSETELERAYNAAVQRLNEVLFSFQDYAVIAHKPR